MNLDYEAKVVFIPETGKRGERVTMKVDYENVDPSESDRSVLRISEYGIYDVMKKEGDRSFSWSYSIPWEAPLRTYEIEVYVLDAQGNKGPIQSVRYQVSG
ncbi:hypothetical protein [Cohnella herbarum]|uniref:Intracellular proteinase inhibitor BsuPI domain-containing protein n=1 Tax=Cohnella herbarum TaxID=2728023 RepID=A0A7Z2ZP50_9BACL|nr:hypothetical protein [Cohnella herbarum]QJD87096.1 hypothetical protein HH215_30595 [Cohnella herbarum]